jgi:hypothetical protein
VEGEGDTCGHGECLSRGGDQWYLLETLAHGTEVLKAVPMLAGLLLTYKLASS